MNWKRSAAIIRKELWEFRKQKYILYSLLIPPLIFALVLPTVSFLPILGTINHVSPSIADVYRETQGFPAPSFTIDESNYASFLANLTPGGIVVIDNANISNLTIVGSYCTGSIIDASDLRECRINKSVLRDCRISDGIISDSLLINVTLQSSVVIDCMGLNNTFWSSSASRSPNLEIVSTDGLNTLDFMNILLDMYSFMLMLAPAITPTIIASYTFVGEKNSKSLEPLLATPATDKEILWGKILAIFIPTMLTTLVGYVFYAIVTNIIFSSQLGYAPLPNSTWLFSMIILAPLMCFLSITANVIISSRMSDVRASQQVGSLVVMPVLLLFIGSFTGIFSLGAVSIVMVAGVLLVVDIAVYLLATKAFQRETILIKWK